MDKLKDELLMNSGIFMDDKELLRWYNRVFKAGQDAQRKELIEIIENRRIECTMKFGEWWVKLDSLKKNLEDNQEKILLEGDSVQDIYRKKKLEDKA